MVKLVREPVGVDAGEIIERSIFSCDEDLKIEARRLFCQYKVKPASPDEIRSTLAALQIHPYSEESVKKYKQVISLRCFIKSIPYYIYEHVLPRLFVMTLGSTLIFSIMMSAVITAGYTPHRWLGIACSSMIALGSAVFFVLCAAENRINLYTAAWHQRPVYETIQEMPSFALQTAVDIRRHCPNACMWVEELDLSTRMPDPFLVIGDSERNRYYVEVWNEPKFIKC